MILKKIQRYIFLIYKQFYNKKFLLQKSNEIQPSKNVDIIFFIVAFNNPEVIDIQQKLLKKYVVNTNTSIVIDNSSDENASQAIQKVCLGHGTHYVRLKDNPWNGIHPSMSHGLALNWIVKYCLPVCRSRYIGFLDHDIFPVSDIDFNKLMDNIDFWGLRQQRKDIWYFWPGLFFCNTDILLKLNPDFRPNSVGDTGVRFYRKIIFCNKKRIKFISEAYVSPFGTEKISLLDHYFIHTRNASCWKDSSIDNNMIIKFLEEKTGTKLSSPILVAHELF